MGWWVNGWGHVIWFCLQIYAYTTYWNQSLAIEIMSLIHSLAVWLFDNWRIMHNCQFWTFFWHFGIWLLTQTSPGPYRAIFVNWLGKSFSKVQRGITFPPAPVSSLHWRLDLFWCKRHLHSSKGYAINSDKWLETYSLLLIIQTHGLWPLIKFSM